ncbi:MAG TPA: RNA pyrophosphohydrolase [Alphaproteobacteria bacterium]|nr:RNA pyrophosphohydrolase [Alphaproteobacteria bacterium]
MPTYRNCAGIILFNDKGKVLMGARADKKGQHWQFPQGGIEDGEKPQEAALRELREETSVKSAEIIMSLNEPISYTFPKPIREGLAAKGKTHVGQKMYWFLLHFTGQDNEINVQTETPEFKAYEWTDIKSAPKRIIFFKKGVYHRVCRIFEPYIEAYIHRAECLVGNVEDEIKEGA